MLNAVEWMAEIAKGHDSHEGNKSLFEELIADVITPRPGAEPKKVVTQQPSSPCSTVCPMGIPYPACSCQPLMLERLRASLRRCQRRLTVPRPRQAVNEAYSKLLEEAYSADLSEIDDEASRQPTARLRGFANPDLHPQLLPRFETPNETRG